MGGFLFIFDMFMPFLQYTQFQPLYLDKRSEGGSAANTNKCLFLGHLLLKKPFDNYYVLLQVLKLVVIFTLSMFLFSPVSNLCVKIFQFITL